MKLRTLRLATAALVIASVMLLDACSSKLGWGVVLWTAPEGPLPAGSVVPVYIKSNIQQVYVVGVPKATGKDKGKKIELPLWQVELYSSRGKALERVKTWGANTSLYMVASRDGLPLRDAPTNAGRRVFRLHEGQSVKILEQVSGDQVNTGNQILQGTWYHVLADDGTQGYAFSYAYKIYDETKEKAPVIASSKADSGASSRVDLVFSRSWRPEYFQEMLDDNRIDLDYFSMRYGLFTDALRKQVRLELPGTSQLFSYSNISEENGYFRFDGTPLVVQILSDSRIVCTWNGSKPGGGDDSTDDESAPAPAKSQAVPVSSPATEGTGGSVVLVSLSSEPRTVISQEQVRRQKLLIDFVDSLGSGWTAPGAGNLVITKNGSFQWKGRGSAASPLVPDSAGDSGEIAFRLALDPSLASSWQGAFSLRFAVAKDQSGSGADQAQADSSSVAARTHWLDFVYRMTPAGLVINSAGDQGLLVTQSSLHSAELTLSHLSE